METRPSPLGLVVYFEQSFFRNLSKQQDAQVEKLIFD